MAKPKYRPVKECFEVCSTIRSSDDLYADFLQERTDVKKFIFYLWLQKNELNSLLGYDEYGDLGYGLRYVPNEK